MVLKRVRKRADTPKMDFKRLPNHIGVKIFNYLPIENQVRVGRVSRRFEELSSMTISTMTEFYTANNVFKDANLEKLIRLCAGSLKNVTISDDSCNQFNPEHYTIKKKRIELVSQLPHPQLIKLAIYKGIEAETLRQLLINCPNIRHLLCIYDVGEFPSSLEDNSPAITCEKVESLNFYFGSATTIESYIDICPRLKYLRISLPWNQDQAPSQGLNKVLSKCLGLELLRLEIFEPNDPHTNAPRIGILDNLWRLSSLRSLSIKRFSAIDDLGTISSRLGQLEDLSIQIDERDEHGQDTLRAMTPLLRMKNLRRLQFFLFGNDVVMFPDPLWLDQGIYQLAGHQRLECITVNFQMSSITVTAFALNCPRLKILFSYGGISGIDSKTKAKQFVKGLRGFVQENFTIAFVICKNEEIWLSNTVQSALSRVNAAASGRSINIEVEPPPRSWWPTWWHAWPSDF